MNADTSIILHLGTVYRLPDASHAFFDFFESALQNIVHSERQILMMGDLNIDLFKDDIKQRKYKDILESFNLTQHVSSATRVANQSETLIDHVVSSSSVLLDQIVNSNEMFSDHNLIGCRVLSFGLKVPPPVVYQKCNLHAVGLGYDFQKCDKNKLGEILIATDWSLMHSALTVDRKWEVFQEFLLDAIEQTTPLFQCKCGKRKQNRRRNHQPWFTPELKALKNQCDVAKDCSPWM